MRDLAELLDRSPGSVAFKLVNFASLDPSLQSRGIKGASNSSKLDKEVWQEFYLNWEELAYESEALRAKREGVPLETLHRLDESGLPKEGKERERLVKVRVNQSFFRRMVLAAYDNTCCITGMGISELLVAGHIRRWTDDHENRMNPHNGLAMNALHDRAFESGWITVTPQYKVLVAEGIQEKEGENSFISRFHGQSIRLPRRFLPDPEFLADHVRERFRG